MPVNIGSVLFPVNYASDYAVEITYTACSLAKVIFAGLFIILLQERHLFHCFRQEHSCSALCSAPGICQIDTTPQSIEATFTGRHETFQYTKVWPSLLKDRADILIVSSIRKVCSLPFCFTFLRVRCSSCEASPLRQDNRSWRGRTSRSSYS